MAKSNKVETQVVTKSVRLSYLHVSEPQAGPQGGEAKYSASLIIRKGDTETVGAIRKAIQAALEVGKDTKFKGKIPKVYKNPLRDGDEEREDEAYANSFFLNARNATKPKLFYADKSVIVDEEDLYSGCYAKVILNFYPFNTSGSVGVAVSLQAIMKVKDGEPLGGTTVSVDQFGEDDDEDFEG